MPHSAKTKSQQKEVKRKDKLSDEDLLDLVQRQTFLFFWDGAQPASGLARDRTGRLTDPADDDIAIGGSGFGAMALIVACERGWVTREEACARLSKMLDCLEKATCYHGLYPHFMHGGTGATKPFSRKDDGADLVESAFLFQGLLCARAYFDRDTFEEKRIRDRIAYLWSEAEWDWYIQGSRTALTWHWSPTNGFALNHPVRGWNECLIAYVLAASAPRYSMPPEAYHEGWVQSRQFVNGRSFEGVELPLGPDGGGPLFFTHYSFCGIDPRGLSDAYADYWKQNIAHTRINYAYCVRNPLGFKGYGPNCWGLTAGDSVKGYDAHSPSNDRSVITPSAALASFPYAPNEAMAALRHFYDDLGDKIWGRFGFIDGFSEQRDWYADSYLAISQGPIVVMIENYRTGLIWKLFMSVPEIREGMKKLGFKSLALRVRDSVTTLDDWIENEARFAVDAMLRAVSATQIIKERPGFGQRVAPRSGSVVASPVLAAYDPDPDYFFHWFRDSAIIIDALRVAASDRSETRVAVERLREFVDFNRALRKLDGREFVRKGHFREKVRASFLQYVRPDDEIETVFGGAVLGDARVNPDGTLDFTRWARPQNDGPALQVLALTRWRNTHPDLDEHLRAAMLELVIDDLNFIRSRATDRSFDIWEEEPGHHYYTQLVQAEALVCGAEWLAKTGDAVQASNCRSVADALPRSLDAYWSAGDSYYRSRMGVADGGAGKALDIAVMLGVLHAGREAGAHTVLDPKVQATMAALEDLFEAEYPINRDRPPQHGPALGRYASDAYYGGNPWYLATLAAAEFYFKLAIALRSGAPMPQTAENAHFRERLGDETPAKAAFEHGDSFMRTVQAYTPSSGDLSEQFDRATGAQTSAKHLAWSYAAFITAAASRRQAAQANRG